jgi:hypothetical protein
MGGLGGIPTTAGGAGTTNTGGGGGGGSGQDVHLVELAVQE